MKVELHHYSNRQRDKIKIHSWDTWSMDHSLAKIILPLMKRYKADCNGIPSAFMEKESRLNDNEYEEKWAEWHRIIDKIIWSMEQIAYDREGPSPPPTFKELKLSRTLKWNRFFETIPARKEDGTIIPGLLQKKHQDERDPEKLEKWRKEIHELNSRVQEGCELFGKYFRSFWC